MYFVSESEMDKLRCGQSESISLKANEVNLSKERLIRENHLAVMQDDLHNFSRSIKTTFYSTGNFDIGSSLWA